MSETTPPAAPEDATPRRIVSEDLPLSIAAGVATAVVMSLLDVGAAWALAGVVVSTFVADAIKTELRSRGLSKRRLGLLTVLLLLLDRVKSAFGATPRERPAAPPPPATARWELVPVTAVLATAIVVCAFTVADVARGSAVIGSGRTSFFGGGHGSSPTTVAATTSTGATTTAATDTGITATSTAATTTAATGTAATTATRPTQTQVTVQGGDALEVVFVDDGAGTVTSRPAGLDCKTTCAAPFTAGLLVRLAAQAGVGSRFGGWTGCKAAAGSPTCEVRVDGPTRVTAAFVLAPDVEQLDVNVTAGGRVTSEPKGIDCPKACSAAFPPGSTVTLTAVAVQGGAFSGWGGVDCSKPTCTFTLDGFRSVTANFEGPR